MEQYKDIDVPEFMKNRTKPILTREQQQDEIDKAFFKGGMVGVATTLTIIFIFTLIAIIEMI